jgi:hypothetical protein
MEHDLRRPVDQDLYDLAQWLCALKAHLTPASPPISWAKPKPSSADGIRHPAAPADALLADRTRRLWLEMIVKAK